MEDKKKVTGAAFDAVVDMMAECSEKMLNDLHRFEERPIMLMYLWVATAKGITLREACEQYCVKRDYGLANSPSEAFTMEYDVSLAPRVIPVKISQSEFDDYQIKVAEFLQECLDEINKKEKGK